MLKLISYYYLMIFKIIKLPVARLCFHARKDLENIELTYKNFTKPHPKYKFIKNKSIGAALIDLNYFNSREKYINDIKGKNKGAYQAKKAQSRGYVVQEINRNNYIDEIHEINISLEERQGQEMSLSYKEKKEFFETENNFKYYGVFNSKGKLVAYCNFGFFGNFAAFSQLLGYRNNDGFMHMLIVEIICRLIDERTIEYVMYDTFFGAQPGLQLFKSILGFKPYYAKYSIK